MNAQFTPGDAEARRVISSNLDETLFVEASAGTGKTTSLVGRMVNLVATGRTTLDRIAAITFTEAAAAELRDKVRQELERAASSTYRSELERSRCTKGMVDLDQASIQTLHSFASALLHERPLEAGLPPGFETTDEIAASLKFDEAWDAWLDEALEMSSTVAPHLAIALSLDLKMTQLKDVAKEFHENYSDLEEVDFGLSDESPQSLPDLLIERLQCLADLCYNPDSGDKLYEFIRAKLETARVAAVSDVDPVTVGRMVKEVFPLRAGNAGSSRNWPEPNGPKYVRDSLRAVEDEVRRAAFRPIARELRRFVLEYAQQRRREGRAEFHDLLVWACELLRENIEVRDYFRGKFTHLLIDESQDTDPLQAQIAVLLAEEADINAGPEDRPSEWQDITPKDGKLFVVGDPKQSIYRFRRADISQVQRLRDRLGGLNVSLTQNFRSQKPLTNWVNRVFGEWMAEGESGIQAEYEEMIHRWEASTDDSFGPRVWALCDEETDETMHQLREGEAADIALLLRHAVSAPWQVLDREATNVEGSERYRPATFADICILMPARTGLRHLQLALEGAGVPYRLENASLVFETQEIRDLINCLRAIDDPSNQIATVAALRSPAFACSDVDLFLHREKGNSFNYLSRPSVNEKTVVSDALGVLRDFHVERMFRPIALLVDRFIRGRFLMEAAVGNPRSREQWRRYRFVVEQAGRFSQSAESTRISLRGFLEWMDNQTDENARITETPVPEEDEDAVRIMTIHAAKGLEFPVVVLTGLSTRPRGRPEQVLFDRRNGRVEVGIGPAASRFATEGYGTQLEREHSLEYAERIRLMYVAATRARDHLVLSLRRQPKPTSGRGTLAHEISDILSHAPELWNVPNLNATLPLPTVPAKADGVPLDHSLETRERWMESRDALLEQAARPSFIAATALGSIGDDEKSEPEPSEPWRRGRAGTQEGRALHAVMQSINLYTGEDIDVWARAFAVAEGIPEQGEEIAQLARRSISSSVVQRAVMGGQFWREVPVATPIEAGSLQGFIDLLFEEDGELIVVDYKTDEITEGPEEAVVRYRMQGAAYALALEKATGKKVKDVIFLFPRPTPAVELPLTDLTSLTAEVQETAAKALGTGTG